MTPHHLKQIEAYRQALEQAYQQVGGPVSRQQVAQQMPQVNIATVRRWMERLCRAGLAKKVPDSWWGWRFIPIEANPSPLALARSDNRRILSERILTALSDAEYCKLDGLSRICEINASRTRYALIRLEQLGLVHRVKRGVYALKSQSAKPGQGAHYLEALRLGSEP